MSDPQEPGRQGENASEHPDPMTPAEPEPSPAPPEHQPEGLDFARSASRAAAASPGSVARKKKPAPGRRRTFTTSSGARPDDRDPQLLDQAMGRLVARPRVGARPQGAGRLRSLGRAGRRRRRRPLHARDLRRRPAGGADGLHRLGHPAQAAHAHGRTPSQHRAGARHRDRDRGPRARTCRAGRRASSAPATVGVRATPTADPWPRGPLGPRLEMAIWEPPGGRGTHRPPCSAL